MIFHSEFLGGLALAFAWMNGVNDSGAMAASVVSSRSLSPRQAAIIAACASFLGAILLGSAVARTIGQGLIHLHRLPAQASAFPACIAAAGGALVWCLLGWRLGLPASYTHALLGGWLGAFLSLAGPSAVNWEKAALVFSAVLAAPIVGLLIAWVAYNFLYSAVQELPVSAMGLLRRLEIAVFAFLSLAHGANAAQNSMALWVMGGLLASRHAALEQFHVPVVIRLSCSLAFSLGVLLGSTRILKTIGFRIFRVDTLHSLCALGVSGSVVLAGTLAGMPLSPGQVNSSSLLGAGAGHNARAVRWDVAFDLLTNWVLSFPASALFAYIFLKVVQ